MEEKVRFLLRCLLIYKDDDEERAEKEVTLPDELVDERQKFELSFLSFVSHFTSL